MHPDWVRAIRDHCQAAGVPFFFKQWGAWRPRRNPQQWPADVGMHTLGGFVLHDPRADDDRFGQWTDGRPGSPVFMDRVGKGNAGRHLDGRTWDQMPEAVAR